MTDAWPGTPVEEWPGTPVDDWPGTPVAEPKRQSVGSSFVSGLGAGVEGVGEQASTLYRMGAGEAAGQAAPTQTPAPVDERTRDYSVWQKITDPEWLAYNIGQTLPQSAPFLGGAVAGGAAGTAVLPGVGTLIGAMIGGGGVAGAQALADSYNEARRAGQDHDAALTTAMYSALASAGINAASVPAGMIGLAKGPISYALRQMAVQPAIGAADQFTQNIVARERGVDPDRPLSQGVGESAFLEAIFEAPSQATATRQMARRIAEPATTPQVSAEEAPQVQPIEPPPQAPDVNEPFGIEREGRILPARVLDYFEQDGVQYARIAEEVGDGAAMPPVEVVAVEDLLPSLREPIETAEPEGRLRRDETPVTEVESVDQMVNREPVPERTPLGLERPNQPIPERRLDQLRVDELSRRMEGLTRVIANVEDNRDIAINNFTGDGLSVDQAEQRLNDNLARWREQRRALNAEIERRNIGTPTPEADARTGVAPLLYQRPAVSEADTGPIGGGATMRVARPEPEARAPVPLLEQRPARSEATEGPMGGGGVWRPKRPEAGPDLLSPRARAEVPTRAPKPEKTSTLYDMIRRLGISNKDSMVPDIVEAMGHKAKKSRDGNWYVPTMPGLVRRNGVSLDQLREAAAEQGMLRNRDDTTINDLIDAAADARNVVEKESVEARLQNEEVARYEALREQYGDNPNADAVAVEDAAEVADMHEAANERAFDAYENGEFELEPVDYLNTEGGDFVSASPENLSLEEFDDATRSAQEQPVDTDQVPADVGPRGSEARRSQEGQATGETPGASRETAGEGPAFERVRNVEGATEQAVIPGTEQSARQAQAKRDADGGLRGKGEQKPPGGLFESPESPDTTGSLFEVQGPVRETPEMSEAMVRDAIAAIAGPDAAKRAKIIPGQTGFRGGYDRARAVIEVAVRSPDMRGTLRHESLHYLKDMGAFSEPEWKSLLKETPKWRQQFDIDRRYTGDVVRRADGRPVSAETLEAVRQEESIAAAYAEWARGDMPGLSARIKALFERIRAILDQIRAQIMGDPLSARAIFYDMDNGRFVPNATRAERMRFGSSVADADMAAANVAADGEHAVGQRASSKETRDMKMWEREPESVKTGPRFLSWGTRKFSFPLARAANDERFAPYVAAELSREKRESAITFSINEGLEPIFRLPRKEQEDVRKALELIALNNAFPPVVNSRMTVQNNTDKVARLTGPRRVVRLSPDATKAMVQYKRAMNTAWDSFAQAAVRAATNYTGDMTPAAARAEAQMQRDKGSPRAAKEAEMAAAILEAAAEKKRQGYYPAMRQGDTAVIVRSKLTPEFARIAGQAKARGYPVKERITGARLKEFIDAAQTPQETKFWSELKSDFDDERARLGVESIDDKMVWNEHFYIKPPFMGDVVPQSPKDVQRAKDAKIAEVRALMEKRGLDMSNYEIVTRPVKDDIRAIINDQSVPVLEKLIKVATDGDPRMYAELWPKVREAIGQELLAGFRRPSDVVPGFSMEMGDTLSRYSHAVGSVSARLEYKRQIEDTLKSVQDNHPDPAMRGPNGYAATLQNYINDPTQDYNALKSFGFMYYLAGVPSTAVQNLTQIPMIAIPQMTAIAGLRGTGIISGAWGDALKAVRVGKDGVRIDMSKLARTPEEKAFLRGMEEKGQLRATVTRDLMGRDFDVGPRLQAAQSFWQKTYTLAASMFETAESVNRATALLAGYRAAQVPAVQERLGRVYAGNQNYRQMAERGGGISPEAFGEFFSREVNFEGSRVNRPEALRGLSGVILQFKSYPMNYISLIRRNATQMGPEGKAAAAVMMGMMLLGGGLMGLPFAEDFSDAFDGITKLLLDDDPQSVATLTQILQDWGLSAVGAEMVMRGVSRPSGVDLSRTLGMGNVMPRMDDPVQVLGPTASALASVYYGYQRMSTGQGVASAAMEVAPRAVKGPLQATAVLPEEGLVSRSGRQIIPPSEITGGQRVARGLGFQPTEFSREYERRGYRQELTAEAQRVATKLRVQYQRLNALAVDQEKQGKVRDAAETRARARRIAEDMMRRGIKPPTGRDAVGPNLDAEGAAMRQAPRRLREEMSRNPYVGRE